LAADRYVFLTIAAGTKAPDIPVIGSFQEPEGTTIICDELAAKIKDLPSSTPFRMITLQVHSSLGAVGFLARISTALAAAAIPCNVISAFHHDHLFIPVDSAESAMNILTKLSQYPIT